ncbi:MAG: Ig-like domain-containing protein [Bacteroidota bacterium]
MKVILRTRKYIVACFLLLIIMGCASTGSPSGGPRDKDPPDLVEEKSSKNFSTNFTPEKIELVFDEWIELKNQQREILISPPFFRNPKITSRGKKVTVEFPEEEPLREDATYTINFGKSIVDFTEGNAAEGFRFVFATGDKIDSLTFQGSIADALDDSPVKDILVLLYDVLEDSVVVSEKPFYYARTDDAGEFKFENLKNDTFKILVLEDINFNYLLDPEAERLAFTDSLFILNDSASFNPKLRLFTPEQSLKIANSSSSTPGVISTVFNKPAEEADFEFLYPEAFDPIVESSKDTLLFWFSEPRDSVGVVYGLDTLDFTVKPFDSIFYTRKLVMREFNADRTILAPFDSLSLSFSAPIAEIDTSLIRLTNKPKPKAQASGDSLTIDSLANSLDSLVMDSLNIRDSVLIDLSERLTDSLIMDSLTTEIDTLLNTIDSLVVPSDTLDINVDSTILPQPLEPVDSLGLDSIPTIPDTLLRDTVDIINDSLAIDSMGVIPDTALVDYEFSTSSILRKLFVNSKWEEKKSYRLELLPGAVTDIYGRSNDTLSLEFSTAARNEFGSITINLSGLDSGQHYVVLLKLNEDVLKMNRVIDVDSTNNKIVHDRLRVNTYSIELIKDDNNDGKWTTGDYWLKRQPEELKTFTLEKLREDWDLEANVFWNDEKLVGVDTSGVVQDSTELKRPPKEETRRRKGTGNDRGSNRERGIKPDPKGKND